MSIDAMKQALEALEECTAYTSSESWSPSMTRECETAITALRAAIEQAQDPETELETYKRLYELRGKALERPCSNCGHQPAKIKAMAQPEQEPVAWMYHGIRHDDTPHERPSLIWKPEYMDVMSAEKGAKATPLYTAPRQWQGLTDEEVENMMDYWSEPARSAYGGAHTANGEYVCIADIIRDAEKRLKEKNT